MRTFSNSSGSRGTAGSALLTVLWLTAALSAIGLAVANNVRGETERATTNVDDVKAYFIARGAIFRAGMRMGWGPDYYRRGDPAMDLPFPNAQVRVEIIPENSKLGLNQILPAELLRLLEALGVAEDRAIEITAAIEDWRSPVLPDKTGPFDAFYLAQTPSFLPRHSSFIEDEELLRVKGITPELYYGGAQENGRLDSSRAGLRDCLSTYANSSIVDVNTAKAETMMATGISREDADAIIRRRNERPIQDYVELGNLVQSLGPAGGRLTLGGASMYTLRATAQLKQPDGKLSDMRRTVAALVKFVPPGNTQGRLPGMQVVRWYDRT